MPRVSPAIYLSAAERSELEKIAKGQKAEKRMYLRSTIILMAAEGMESTEIAKVLNISEKTCRKWRHRFAEKRMEGIVDLERSGAPEIFTEEERLEIIKLACTPPDDLKNWTLAHLTDQAREKIGRSISIETVRQILRSASRKTATLPASQHKIYIKQSGKRDT